MDEVSREAHKTAAVAGFVIGLVLWAIGISAVMFGLGPNHAVIVAGHQGSLAVFAAGGLAFLIVQTVCSGLGLAGWWVSKR